MGSASREGGGLAGLPAFLDALKQASARVCLALSHQIDVNDLREKSGRTTVANPHWNESPLYSVRVLGKRGCPLTLRKRRFEISPLTGQ